MHFIDNTYNDLNNFSYNQRMIFLVENQKTFEQSQKICFDIDRVVYGLFLNPKTQSPFVMPVRSVYSYGQNMLFDKIYLDWVDAINNERVGNRNLYYMTSRFQFSGNYVYTHKFGKVKLYDRYENSDLTLLNYMSVKDTERQNMRSIEFYSFKKGLIRTPINGTRESICEYYLQSKLYQKKGESDYGIRFLPSDYKPFKLLQLHDLSEASKDEYTEILEGLKNGFTKLEEGFITDDRGEKLYKFDGEKRFLDFYVSLLK